MTSRNFKHFLTSLPPSSPHHHASKHEGFSTFVTKSLIISTPKTVTSFVDGLSIEQLDVLVLYKVRALFKLVLKYFFFRIGFGFGTPRRFRKCWKAEVTSQLKLQSENRRFSIEKIPHGVQSLKISQFHFNPNKLMLWDSISYQFQFEDKNRIRNHAVKFLAFSSIQSNRDQSVADLVKLFSLLRNFFFHFLLLS